MIITFPTEKIDLKNCYDSAINNEKFTRAFSKYLNLDLDCVFIDQLHNTYADISYVKKGQVGCTSVKVSYKNFPKNSSFKLKC